MWGAIAGAVIGGLMSSNASKSAADTQSSASDRATAAQERMFNKQVELQAPFRDAGLTANNRLMHMLGIGRDPSMGTRGMSYEQMLQMADVDHRQKYGIGLDQIDQGVAQAWKDQMRAASAQNPAGAGTGGNEFGSLMRDFSMADFEQDPGYEFRRTEGLKGVEGGAAARGGLLSGGALKAIQKYGQDLASQEYGNAFNRFTGQQTNKYNRLAGVVNTGQGATNQVTNAAGNLGSQMGSNIIGAGNAQAAGIVGGANAWNNAIGQGINSYQSNQLMDLIKRPSGSSGGSSNAYVDQYYG